MGISQNSWILTLSRDSLRQELSGVRTILRYIYYHLRINLPRPIEFFTYWLTFFAFFLAHLSVDFRRPLKLHIHTTANQISFFSHCSRNWQEIMSSLSASTGPVLRRIQGLFAEQRVVDDREALLRFEIPRFPEAGTFEVYAPSATPWILLTYVSPDWANWWVFRRWRRGQRTSSVRWSAD